MITGFFLLSWFCIAVALHISVEVWYAVKVQGKRWTAVADEIATLIVYVPVSISLPFVTYFLYNLEYPK